MMRGTKPRVPGCRSPSALGASTGKTDISRTPERHVPDLPVSLLPLFVHPSTLFDTLTRRCVLCVSGFLNSEHCLATPLSLLHLQACCSASFSHSNAEILDNSFNHPDRHCPSQFLGHTAVLLWTHHDPSLAIPSFNMRIYSLELELTGRNQPIRYPHISCTSANMYSNTKRGALPLF